MTYSSYVGALETQRNRSKVPSPAPSDSPSKDALFHRVLGYHKCHTGRHLSSVRPPSTAVKRADHPTEDHSPPPRETLLPHLTPAQAAALPYPPALFPGARDIETPYGVMRAYEWGRDDGMKDILVHGDNTPGPILGPIAQALFHRGCRVMIIRSEFYRDTLYV